jgi:polyisoprenoid-binding protein YceI
MNYTPCLPAALLLSAWLACQLASQASAQGSTVRYETQPGGSKVKIEGTSSVHDWTMQGSVIGGFIETDTGFPESALKGGAASKPKTEIFIPVRSVRSDNARMDEIYKEHMDETNFKKMEFKLTELKPKGDAPKDGKCEFDAVGTLTVHGVAKPITMPVTIEKADKKLKITGSTPLKMTDFTVKPVDINLGVSHITTGDDIKVSFEWTPGQK